MKDIKFKLAHILFIILISIVISIAIFNTTLLSKENIIELINYAAAITQIEIAPTDSLFLARIVRQQLWQVHFFIGIILPIFSIVLLSMHQKINLTKILNVGIIFYMSFIGTLLYLRKEFLLEPQIVEILRTSHWFGVYAFIVIIVYHILSVVRNRKIEDQK